MTTPPLPTPGGSNNIWGTELNTFLQTAGNYLLGYINYAPVSGQTTYNANIATLAAMDTTNLTLSVVVPVTGNFYVDVSADWAWASNGSLSSATDMFMALVLHGTTTLLCPMQSWFGSNQPNTTAGGRSLHRYFVTGQTPGAIVQFDLAMGISSITNISFAAFYAAGGGVLSSNPASPILVQAFAS